ncbi:MAG: hypothetical protein FIA90_10920 [candidate division NC10 bacterium]|nr:hypothetical protein [candidate division NC10 bacterium]
MRPRNRRSILMLSLLLAITGCATLAGTGRVVKSYPRPAKETLVAVNLALRDLHFFPTDLLPSHSNPRLTYVSTAYRELSRGDIVYVAVRYMGPAQALVEVLTRGDLSGVWTWSVWWPPLIFEQTDRRIRATLPPQAAPTPPPPLPDRLAL